MACHFPPVILPGTVARGFIFSGAGMNISETLILCSVLRFVAVEIIISLPTVAALFTRIGIGLLLTVL